MTGISSVTSQPTIGPGPSHTVCLPIILGGMSSGFVSGGTTDTPVEHDEEWLKAQQEIEANRRKKEGEGKQDGGKSLYEILQNNKGESYFPSTTRHLLLSWPRLADMSD